MTLALLIARHYLLRWLERLASRTATRLDELFIESLRTPTILWCVAIGLMAGLETAPLPRRLATWGTSLVAALLILSAAMVGATALVRILRRFPQAGIAIPFPQRVLHMRDGGNGGAARRSPAPL